MHFSRSSRLKARKCLRARSELHPSPEKEKETMTKNTNPCVHFAGRTFRRCYASWDAFNDAGATCAKAFQFRGNYPHRAEHFDGRCLPRCHAPLTVPFYLFSSIEVAS